jgi:PAS domain S-box-containing protein
MRSRAKRPLARWVQSASLGTLFRQALRPGQLKIGTRLTLCFAAIVVLMAVAGLVTLWQFTLIRGQAHRLNQVDQKSLAMLRVHANLLMFQDRLATLATTQDAQRFAEEAGMLRRQFLEEVELANQALRVPPVSVERDPAMLSTLETIQSTLPAQIDALTGLAAAGDWSAVRLRLRNQVAPLNSLTSTLVENVDLEVAEERAQALENIQRVQQRVFLMLPVTAVFTLLIAGMLGVMVTRSITRPLSQLDAGAQALARGEFQHQVTVEGNDELASLAGVFNDATHRLSALYRELLRSEAEFRIIFEHSAIGMVLVDPGGQPIRTNRALQSMLGYREEELVKLSFVDVTHPEDVALDVSLYQDVVEGRLDRYQIKKRFVRKDGETCWARLSVSAFRTADATLQYSVAMVEDITAQELAEQSLHQLSTRMLRIQEEEQRRIAREVHDSTSQEMTALTLNLGALRVMENELPHKARKQVTESLALAKRVAREIRTFSYLLHPPMLNELGLWSAMRLFVEEFKERSGLQVSLQISSELEKARLNPAHEMALFRFVQEALANIHRHSGSETADVGLRLEDGSIEATVADTGRGIPAKTLKEIHAPGGGGGGVGIPGMQERIGVLGGRVEVRSHHKGTIVTAVVPAEFVLPPAAARPKSA